MAHDIPAQYIVELSNVPASGCSIYLCALNDCSQLGVARPQRNWRRLVDHIYARLAIDWFVQLRCIVDTIAFSEANVSEYEVRN